MNPTRPADDLHRIAVLNPKGGCGKTTLATNLASLYALRGSHPTLVDCDAQGYSLRWLEKRRDDRPAIRGIAGYEDAVRTLRSLKEHVHPESSTVIVDLPGAIPTEQLHMYTSLADSVLIPIVPSEIDVYSASRFIAELLLDAQLDRRDQKLAIVANRVRTNTKSYRMLKRFLASLRIPLIASLRDTQNFVHAAAAGVGICEMPPHAITNDIEPLTAIMEWLDKWRARRFEAYNHPLAQPRASNVEIHPAMRFGPVD
jgi:chromosome partitioning protein